SEIVSVWFAKYLTGLSAGKQGDEISRKALAMIDQIRQHEKDIDEKIDLVDERIKKVENNISTMKNYPRLLRERVQVFTEAGDPATASRMLDTEYHSLLQKVIDFDNFISSLEFKHLIMDLVDEWYQAKDYILDDLNTVKEYIAGEVESTYKQRCADTAAVVQKMIGKKVVVLAEFEDLRAQLSDVGKLDHEQMGLITGKIAQFTTSMLLFDLEASKMLIEQPASIEGYQAFLDSWSGSRAEMEREIDGGIAAVDRWIEANTRGKDEEPGSTERAMKMHKFFSSFIRSSIQDFRVILDEFQSKNEHITNDFFTKRFEDIEKAINFKKSKLLDLIENKAYLIEKYWRALKQASHDIEFLVGIGRLKEEWVTTKENIVEKIQRHYHAQLERIDAEKIKQMLRIVNPIPIGSLKNKLKSIAHEDDVRYIAGVIDIVQKHQINALVQNNALVNTRDCIAPEAPGVPVAIKASASARDTMMALKVIVENKSIHEVYDVAVSIKLPAFLAIHDKNRSNHRQSVIAIESGKSAAFAWDVEENRALDPGAAALAVQLSKIVVVVSGKLPGEQLFSKTEDLNVILKRA
ncbi:MAG: hypothetical protein JW839_01245, partial [Candidatus Lokiarchaeota archaeon]|nr:hypothetical protein [Candidatus Lokiarchaeota archaeon]